MLYRIIPPMCCWVQQHESDEQYYSFLFNGCRTFRAVALCNWCWGGEMGLVGGCVEWVENGLPDHVGRRKPLSRFMFRVSFLILMASTVLSQRFSTFLWTVVPSQLMQWLFFWTWIAIPFLRLHVLLLVCVHLAWLSMFSFQCFLSPTYTSVGNSYRDSYTPFLSVITLESWSHSHQLSF